MDLFVIAILVEIEIAAANRSAPVVTTPGGNPLIVYEALSKSRMPETVRFPVLGAVMLCFAH